MKYKMYNYYLAGLNKRKIDEGTMQTAIHLLCYIIACVSSYYFSVISSVVLIALAIESYLFFYKKTNDIIDIIGVFSAIWDFSIGLGQLRLSAIQTDWLVVTWITFAFVPILFWYGFVLSQNQIYFRKKRNGMVFKSYDGGNKSKYYKDAVFWGFVSIGLMIVQYMIKGYFPFFNRTIEARFDFYTKFIIIIASLQVVPPIAICILMRDKTSNIKKFFLFVSMFGVIASTVLRTSRGDLMITICAMIPAVVHGMMFRAQNKRGNHLTDYERKLREKRCRKKIAWIAAIIVVGFLIVSGARGETVWDLKQSFLMPYYNNVFLDSKVFTFGYFYLVNGFENFDYAVRNCHEFTYGLRQLEPPSHVFQWLKPVIADLPLYRNLYSTTSCLITNFYLDFGFIGVVLEMFLFGYVTGIIHFYYKRNKEYITSCVYGVVFSICMLSFFDCWISVSTMWIMLGMAGIIYLPHLKIYYGHRCGCSVQIRGK